MDTIETLKNKIWVTRKARIRASERLTKSDYYSKLMLAWYSFSSLAFSVIELKVQRLPKDFSLFDVLLGIMLFGAAIYVNTLNFASRSAALKKCYLSLDQLYLDLCQISSADQSKVDAISRRYTQILEETENHSEYDYFGVILSQNYRLGNPDGNLERGHLPTLIFPQRVRYWAYHLGAMLLGGSVFLFPIGIGWWAFK